MAEQIMLLDQKYLEELSNIDLLLKEQLIKHLLVDKFLEESSLDLFLNIYNFVIHYGNKDVEAEHLYNYYKNTIEYFSNELAKKLNDISKDKIIDTFIDIANRMDFLISFMSKSFSYVDLFFVKSRNSKSLLECALEIYKNIIFLPVQKELIDEVNKLINEDRKGKKENRTKIKKVINIFKIMVLKRPKIHKENNTVIWKNAYDEQNQINPIKDYWFKLFLEETKNFISSKVIQDIHNKSITEYISTELKFLEEEEERQKELFDGMNLKGLNEILYEEILGKNIKELVEMDSGIKYMFENNKYEDLSNLFNLFKFHEPSLHELAKILRDYILKKGEELNQIEIKQNQKELVTQLIELKNNIDTLMVKCFKKNEILKSARDKAFYELMGTNYYSKQIANFLDFCMRIGFKEKDQITINNILDDIIDLFKNLPSKDVFLIEAEKLMSERLIKSSTLSINNEKNFVNKFKGEVNLSFVNKMINMLSDFENNEKDIKEYSKTSNKGKPGGIKFNVKVIQPSSLEMRNENLVKFNLPKLFSSCINDFENYYLGKYTNYKLKWYLNISSLEIQYLYLKDINISISTLPQVLILLELENKKSLSIKELAKALNCDIQIIKNSIEGLIFNISFNPNCKSDKGVLISTTTTSKNLNDEDKFEININFSPIKKNFSTIPMSKKKTKEEIKNEEESEEEYYRIYRNNIIQVTIIRIMKSRKEQTTTKDWLVSETINQIDRFMATSDMIEYNIENLIKKHLLKKSENFENCFEIVN